MSLLLFPVIPLCHHSDIVNRSKSSCAAFLANYDSRSYATVSFNGLHYNLPPWSISILPDCKTTVFNTAKIGAQSTTMKMQWLGGFSWKSYTEDTESLNIHKGWIVRAVEYVGVLGIDIDHNEQFLEIGRYPILNMMSAGHSLHVFINGQPSGTAYGGVDNPKLTYSGTAKLWAGSNKISLLSVSVCPPKVGNHFERWNASMLGPVTLTGLNQGKREFSWQTWTILVYMERLWVFTLSAEAPVLNGVKHRSPLLASCHCVALDAEGRCYTWGRNEKGQLGHGDTRHRDMPTIVSELSKYKVISAGAGRNHTVVVTEDGKSFSFGLNKHGQLGTGSAKNEMERSPASCLVSEATSAVCGGDFTVWLSSIEGSSILTAGLPQYGQLGHGTDKEYNAKEGSVRLVYEAQPRPRAISAFSEKTIVKVACGTNHTVAVDSSGFLYTWGFGGYGRLGHREQKDEWAPRLVEVFQRHNVLPPDAIVSAGSVCSACTASGGQLYMWGKLKNTGDDWMYPKPVMDLSGWNIRCMDSGNMHHVIGADDSCISWGVAHHGELGYGPFVQKYAFGIFINPKSSAYPQKVESLDGMHVTSVACGLGLSLIVVDRTNVSDRLEKLEVFEGENAEGTEENNNCTVTPSIKKKGAAKSSENAKKRKKQKDSLESEEEDANDGDEEDEADSDDEVETKSKGRKGRGAKRETSGAKTKGQGRGRPKKSEEKKSSGRGRGRPRKSLG